MMHLFSVGHLSPSPAASHLPICPSAPLLTLAPLAPVGHRMRLRDKSDHQRVVTNAHALFLCFSPLHVLTCTHMSLCIRVCVQSRYIYTSWNELWDPEGYLWAERAPWAMVHRPLWAALTPRP